LAGKLGVQLPLSTEIQAQFLGRLQFLREIYAGFIGVSKDNQGIKTANKLYGEACTENMTLSSGNTGQLFPRRDDLGDRRPD
jgi:hypothetical protein